MITILHESSSYVKVLCENVGILQEIEDQFTFMQPGFARNKWTRWDGTVKLYSKATGRLPYGLWMDVYLYCKKSGYQVDVDPQLLRKVNLTDAEFEEWLSELNITTKGNPIQPYEYQKDICKDLIKFRRVTALAATSAGKSLAIYLCIRYAMLELEPHEKVLIIVPSINLVNQMYSDFDDYSSKDENFSASRMVHKIYAGQERFTNKPVIVSTWQSLAKMAENGSEFFDDVKMVICDEAHTADSKVLSSVVMKCRAAPYRIGLTGTLKGEKVHELQIKGLFGQVKRYVTAKELIDEGKATKVNVNMVQLRYPITDCHAMKDASYQDEIEFILNHETRTKAIVNLAKILKGNTLMLFSRIDAHLEVVRAELERLGINHKVITGSVDKDDREVIRQGMEDEENCVLLATSATVSTGVSVKRLHNLVFCHPTKSVIRVLQSLGRVMRLHDSKSEANLYDIVDDLSFEGSYNHCMRHASERYGYYAAEKHPVKVKKIKLPEVKHEIDSREDKTE